MMGGLAPPAIAAAYRAACELDVVALKPGNVRDGAPFADMGADDFRLCAAASAPILGAAGAGDATVGAVIRRAVAASRTVVQRNTNLGIVLLAAPLCRAAAREPLTRDAVERVLAALTCADASDAYAAIREARPGGLGRSERHDVAAEPKVTLRAAMCEAAARDTIARQYCGGFDDVFGLGLAAWRQHIASFGDEAAATTFVYMQFLSDLPDSHMIRRHGAAAAATIRSRARVLATPAPSRADLLAFDAELRTAGWNPGTSADLTVASILAAKLAATV